MDLTGHIIGQHIPMMGRLHLLLLAEVIGNRLRDTAASRSAEVHKTETGGKYSQAHD
jgi:hypothetical protein